MPASFLRRCGSCRTLLRVSDIYKPVNCPCGAQLQPPEKRSILEQGRNPLEELRPMVPNFD